MLQTTRRSFPDLQQPPEASRGDEASVYTETHGRDRIGVPIFFFRETAERGKK